jgi:uncharacterized lipoprotein YmbA
MRALQDESATERSAQQGSSNSIGIRTISLPGVINRLQMVRRTGSHELKVESYHRWAEYPDRMVHQLLQENLQRLLPERRVVNAPWEVGLKPDLILSFQFLELIGSTNREMELHVVWTVYQGNKVSLPHRMHLIEPINGNGFDDLAQAHSHVLAELSHEVAKTIKAIPYQE